MQIFTVSQVTLWVKRLIEGEEHLQDLWVEGEISNLTQSAAGHAYFTLKDASSQLRCVLFRSQLLRQPFTPENGLAVVAHGRLSVYEVQGAYQFLVDLVQPQGVGLLHLQFEALRRRLEEEGLFDVARKRPIPRFPKAIGVVTSPTGAALQDILRVLGRRFPLVEVVVVPALVQGEGASESIGAAIAAANTQPQIDILIVARGGGSLEELWPFNEEKVARAIFASRIPVITGIGHETDTTIADLVADLRAPTPSAAAELAVPDGRQCLGQIQVWRARLGQAALGHLRRQREGLAREHRLLRRASPTGVIARLRQQGDDWLSRGAQAIRHALALRHERLRSQVLRLATLNPQAVLERGYSICWHLATSRSVRTTAQVKAGDAIRVFVSNGAFQGVVTNGTGAKRSGPRATASQPALPLDLSPGGAGDGRRKAIF